MPTWNAETIIALAPDPGAAKAGKELAAPRKWANLGASARALWGECQGSGKNPYQTQIDLTGPAFKCTCPSHKFPCKHALALFLLFDAYASSFPKGEPPAWVTAWLQSRDNRAEKKAGDGDAKPTDPAAQAKRASQRENKVDAGITELSRWLNDLMRGGLAEAQSRPYKYWDAMAARLVDAQAPGLARQVAALGAIPASGQGWQERMLESVARLHLLTRAWERIETLSADVQADVRTAIGFTVSQKDLLLQQGIPDIWTVTGVALEEEDKLKIQRTWLVGGTSGKTVLILDFAYAGQIPDPVYQTGLKFTAEMVYFPSTWPLRAVAKDRETFASEHRPQIAASTVEAESAAYRSAVAANPWALRHPFALANAVPVAAEGRWHVQDETGRLPISRGFANAWKLEAISGGLPVGLFGEWNGESLRPLAAWTGERVWPL